jgi:pimeloyl-ACP methyl ester carboxylesterase
MHTSNHTRLPVAGPVTDKNMASADEQPGLLLAFVHGGVHHGGCWNDTVTALRRRCPSLRTIVVDMPGRRFVPGDLETLTIEQCVAAVADQIAQHRRNGEKLVIVGHSLAGVVMPGLVHRLGPHTVTRAVFVACCVPPPGKCVADTLPVVLKWVVHRIMRRSPVIAAVPYIVLRFFFGNGTTRAQRMLIGAATCAESASLLIEVPSARWPEVVASTWILPSRDRAQPPSTQRRSIAALGGRIDVRTIDSGHEVMLTHPEELARTLLDVIR